LISGEWVLNDVFSVFTPDKEAADAWIVTGGEVPAGRRPGCSSTAARGSSGR
jgi:hypothetical protein